MRIRIVLVEPESEGNIGSVARAMKNFAVDDMWLINPKAQIGGEAKALSAHGYEILERAKTVGSLEEALKDVDMAVGTTGIVGTSSSNLTRTAITISQLAERASRVEGLMAIVLGRESRGLTNEELESCDLVASIPANPEYPVLNLAMAATIILYELYKSSFKCGTFTPAADPDIKERIVKHFSDLCDASGIPPRKRKLATRAFRNIISRAFVARREASLILGVLRRSASKCRSA